MPHRGVFFPILLVMVACAGPSGAPGSARAGAPEKTPREFLQAPGKPPEKSTISPPSDAPVKSDLLVSPERALAILWADDEPGRQKAAAGCAGKRERERVRCLILLRYADDAQAREMAIQLYDRVEVVAGLESAYVAEFGYRGTIRIVPERPIGRFRTHLAWIRDGFADIDRVYAELGKRAGKPLRYRWKGLELRFFRSVGRNTPSAYANRWYFGYNVDGSLLHSAQGVRDTLVHEIFHMNDFEHGGWSAAALQTAYDGILARCPIPRGGKWPTRKCLAPWAPAATTVKGGTYYAFQPGNGVEEYGAELGLRYFQEQLEALSGRPPAVPFKCRNAINAAVWSRLAAEFYAGADAVPECKTPPG